MPVEMIEPPAMTPKAQAAHQSSFFRQSGWLMLTTFAGGLLMFAVHPLARAIGKAEYSLFGTLLVTVMLVPSGPLQMVLTQQTARALATGREGELAGMIRLIWLGLTGLWGGVALVVLLCQGWILRLCGVDQAGALWVTLPIVLLGLWAPVFQGVLQGQQNFFWLGCSMIANAVGRVAIAAALVLVVGCGALGMMGGVLAGTALAWAIAMWMTRSLWQRATARFNWPSILRQIIPLMLGFVFVQFLFSGDTMFVRHYFTGDETGPYVSAGTLARAIIWAVMPLASVMFPRIVHSTARAEKTNLFGLVLLGTAVLTACGAAGVTLLGPWAVKVIFGRSFTDVAAQVLPWYALAMVPLALANVLVNNLLARSQFGVVPFTFLLAAAYAATMITVNHVTHSLVAVLQTVGVFNCLLLGVCGWFTWRSRIQEPAPAG